VVGADSATAAILAAGLGGLSITGLTPYTDKWVAMCSLTALLTAALLLIARVLKLGFIGDFLSASVLIGFLTGVGIQVLSGQIPSMLGLSKGSGRWLQVQWDWISQLSAASRTTAAFAAATILVIVGCKRFAPRVPGAIVAVVGTIVVSAATDAKSHGVAVVGNVSGGFPPIGLPSGVSGGDAVDVVGIAASCMIIIIAQSAATSRSFGMKHGDRVDVNRDILGLSGANAAAGLTGTFVVNGSPTKTQILEGQKGRTQVANVTLAAVTLIFTLFLTSLLQDMPEAVLGAIVFLVGVEMIDITGFKRLFRRRRSEAIVATITAAVVCAIGVEQGIVLAIVLSGIELIRRQYAPHDFLERPGQPEDRRYVQVAAGGQSEPGIVVFRFDAPLFYANANRFIDDIQLVVEHAPDPVQSLILDAGTISDVDYSAGQAISRLLDYLDAHSIQFGLAAADPALLETLDSYDLLARVPADQRFTTVKVAMSAARRAPERPSTQIADN
jgi:MFS superfamily sulfate permease-like transporter